MKQFYTSLKSVIALLALNLIILSTNPVFGQYVLQSTDVTISSNYITACSISDFNTAAYDYGNIEIPEQINGTDIYGIGGNPFHGGAMQAKGITALTLPGSIAQIGVFAFADNEISSVTISEGTTRIMSRAFSNNQLTNITLPSTLKELYNLAFDGNTGLTGITLPVNSTPGFSGWEDGNGKLYAGGDVITDFSLNYMAQFVENYTLTDADVTITNGTITACSNSIVGATIVIPNTLQGQVVTGIDANVFSALNIAKIVLPTPETLGFTNWLSGTGTSYNGGANVSDLGTSYTAQFITTYTLTDADVTITNGTITACGNVDNANIIVIPDTLQNQEVRGIGANVLFGYSSVSQIILPASGNPNFIAWMSGTGTQYESGATATDLSTSYTALFRYTLTDADVTINSGIISAYSNVNNGTVIIIPDTLQNQEVIGIDANVFSAYSSISEIVLPTPENSYFVSWISGTGTAYGGGATITDFTTSYTILLNNDWYTLTDADARVDEEGWMQSVSYDFATKNIIIPDTIDGNPVKRIMWGHFEDVGLKKLKLPATLEILDSYAFIHNQIESIEISDSTYIEMGEACFNDNILQEINGKPTNGFIYARNSDGSNDSTTIMSYGGGKTVMNFIPANTTKLGYGCLAECKLTSVTIPDNIVWIDSYAFFENPNLTPTLPTYTDWFDNKGTSYSGGTAITDVSLAYIAKLPHTLTDDDVVVQEGQIIEYNKNKYTLITVPEVLDGQTVTGVRAGVFENKNVFEMYLPAQRSLNGFDGWINFKGNSVAQSNGTYTIKDFSTSYIAKLPQYTLTSMDVVMNGNTFSSCSFPFVITDIIVPETLNGVAVKSFGGDALREKGITSITLPSTLTRIGSYSLAKNALSEITIPASVVTIDYCAFWGGWPNYSNTLKKVTFEEGSLLKTIGDHAFKKCAALEEINLPEGLETIGIEAFFDCSLKSVTIPASIKTIGISAFQEQGLGNVTLISVVFENNSSLQHIGKGAFSSNLSLSGFKLPTSAYPTFRYWNCKGEGTDKPAYSQGETTKIFTAEYIAQYDYTLSCGNVTITDGVISRYYSGDLQTQYIIIPDTLCGQAVTGMKENGLLPAFANYKFKGITLPSTLEYIPNNSFVYNNLSTISIPNKVYHIGANAFGGITADSLILPERETEGFAGWISGQNNMVKQVNGKYVIRNYTTSYDAVYEVKFVDYDGTLLKTDLAKHNKSAVPPTDFERLGYTFTGWDTDYSKITKGLTVTAQYVLSVYNISFVDWNGTVLSQQQLNYGQAAVEPTGPMRSGYTFVGWDVPFGNISSNLTITAQYSNNNTNNYTVTFVDWDATVLSTQTVSEGDAAKEPVQPSRTGYTFSGWDNSFSTISGNITITAQYNINTFLVKFYNYDSILLEAQTVDYAQSAVTPADPTRKGYTFAGWNADFSTITSNLSVYAQYTINSYKVVFADWDGFVFKEQTVNYKNKAIAPANPVRPGYTFNGWDNSYGSIQQDITITATYMKNADENIAVGDYSEGGVVFYIYQQGDAAYKEDTISGLICSIKDAYQYEFAWSPLGAPYSGPGGAFVTIGTSTQLGSGKENTKKIVAHFGKPQYDLDRYNYPAYMCDTMTTNGYSDWFLPDSASVMEMSKQNKTIDNVAQAHGGNAFTYAHNGILGSYWTSSEYNARNVYFVDIFYGYARADDKDEEYNTFVRAVREFSLPKDKYTVYFVDWNRSLLETQLVAKGNAATAPSEPIRTGYTFTGWDIAFNSVTENIMVTAQYVLNTTTNYTVTFKDWDGTVLSTQTIAENSAATAPSEPSRTGYTFTGWDVDFSKVTSDLTITAQYSINTYTVTFKDYDGTELKTETVEYEKSATTPSEPSRTGYTFSRWDVDFSKVTRDLTVIAQYTQNGVTNYTVIFKNWDGTALSTQTVAENSAAKAPSAPSRIGYTFTGWDVDFSKITSDLTVTAQYGINTYTITFKDWDGTSLKTETVEYAKSATAPSDPSRAGYTFSRWDVDFNKVTCDLTVTAQYSQNGVTNYTVIFKNWEGTALSSQTVAENSAATAPSAPSRTGYTFTGWDVDFSKVTSNRTVTALYTINSYSVTYRAGENGTVSSKNQTVNYGSSAVPVTAKPNDGYIFVKWQDKNGNKLSTDNPFTLTKVTCDSIVYAVFEKSTGIEVIPTISNLNVYPNPTEGLVNISLDNEEGIVQLKVYNITGEIVLNNPAFNGGPVDLSDLNKGIYLIEVNSGGEFSIIKLIKQ